jgi:ABC-2 type transport system ATP-binding protein
MTALVEVEHLGKRFGAIAAVNDVSFTVAKGEVLGVLGPNGAGKSTMMRIIAGSLAATSGSARVCGHDTRTEARAAKSNLGYLPEGSPLYADMTPEGFLDFVAAARGLDAPRRRKRVAEVIARLQLEDVLRRPVDTLSKGFKRRLGIAQALVHDPKVLVLDEPTDGLDPIQKGTVRGLIAELSADKAIIISTHLLEEVDSICHRAIFIAGGRLAGGGTPRELHARAGNHNAVSARVDSAAAQRAAELLRALPNVEGARVSSEDGATFVVATPKNGAFIADAVAGALRGAGVDAASLTVETGSLDDVFARLTRGGAGAVQ